MQTHFKKNLLVSISLLMMAACTPQMTQDLWNGNYALSSAHRAAGKEREAYYAKETIEQKELRKKNHLFCSDLTALPENRIYEKGWPNGKANGRLYFKCMGDRGSPIP